MTPFGGHIRALRESRATHAPGYSLRQVAHRVGIEPAYLSKVERGIVPPPSEDTIVKLAEELGEDKDIMLALAGKVSRDLMEIIRQRPALFAKILRQLRDAPDHAVLRIVREVRDGEW